MFLPRITARTLKSKLLVILKKYNVHVLLRCQRVYQAELRGILNPLYLS